MTIKLTMSSTQFCSKLQDCYNQLAEPRRRAQMYNIFCQR